MVSAVEKRLDALIRFNIENEQALVRSTKKLQDLQNVAQKSQLRGAGKDRVKKLKLESIRQKELVQNQQALNKLGKLQEKTLGIQTRKAKQFKFEFLGIMFAGMQLQRITVGFLRTSFKAFTDVFEKTSALERQTNRVSAAWQFFKFRLIEVLQASPAFKSIIDFLVKMIDKLSGLSDKQVLALTSALGTAGLLGALAAVGGAAALAFNSLKIFFVGLGIGFNGFIIVALLAALAIITIKNKFEEVKKVGSTIWKSLKTPFTNIKESLDTIAEALSFEDIFDLISTVGVASFAAIGAVLLNAAFLADAFFMSLANAVRLIASFKPGGQTPIEAFTEGIKDGVGWLDRWTLSNAEYIKSIDSIGEKSKELENAPGFGIQFIDIDTVPVEDKLSELGGSMLDVTNANKTLNEVIPIMSTLFGEHNTIQNELNKSMTEYNDEIDFASVLTKILDEDSINLTSSMGNEEQQVRDLAAAYQELAEAKSILAGVDGRGRSQDQPL